MPSNESFKKDLSALEHRYLPRWEVNNRVLYQLEEDETTKECKTKDLNCSGACLSVKTPHEPNQKIKMNISLSNSSSINVQGNVKWLKRKGEEILMGVTFSNVPEKVQDVILQHAFHLDKKRLAQYWFREWKKD